MKSFASAALAALLVDSAVAKDTNCQQQICCNALSSAPGLEGKVFSPESDVYDARLASYYSANAAQEAWCMVLPKSTEDVSQVAKIFHEHKCPFGMRSGAHSAFKGSNGVKDGVTVDFGWLNATTYDEAAKVSSTQPGSDWGMAYEALSSSGVISVGGRANVVGVGGFTTGGGMSFHSSTQGLACDTVVNFEVVLADGSIVNANAHENSDLWRSLKGGSGNFGFVTRIDQAVVEQPMMWGGLNIYAQDKRDALFDAYMNFVDNAEADPATQNILSFQYADDAFIYVTVLSNIDAVEDPASLSEYLDIETVSSTNQVGKTADLVDQFTGPTPLGLYAEWMTGTTAHDIRVLKFIDAKHKEYIAKMKEAAPDSVFNVLIQIQPFTQDMAQQGVDKGGNVLGLEDVVADGPVINWLIAVTVDTAENQEKIHPISMEYKAAVNDYAREIGVHKDWEFLNYSYRDQNPLANYGPEAVKTMKAASAKYDPEGVFQKQRLTGFRLPGASE